MRYKVFLSLHVFLIASVVFGCDVTKVKNSSSKSADSKTVTFNWDPLSLAQIMQGTPILKKVSANATHVFFAFNITRLNGAPISGLIIKDQQSNFEVRGFPDVTALSAFPYGAWLATKHDEKNPVAPRLITQISNNGTRYSEHFLSSSKVMKLIPLQEGLLSLFYDGVNTPKLFKGDALALDKNTINWDKPSSFDLTANEMGDAALDMIIVDELKPDDLVAVSGGGLYQGNLSDMKWRHRWVSESYSNVEIFPGAPNSMAYFRGRLVVGSFTHPLSSKKSKGLVLCDLSKTNQKNPCEAPSSAHPLAQAKNFEIRKMLEMKDHLYMATSTGLLRFDGESLHHFTRSNPKADLKDTSTKKYRAEGALPSDEIDDIAVQDHALWIITPAGAVRFFVD